MTHSTVPWQPQTAFSTLQARARLFNQVRDFFNARGLLEVETPLLYPSSTTAPQINSMPVVVASQQRPWYLQTSPEFPMKRLLAAGSGSIYQITKAFRCSERSVRHNPEFTLLEWYRVGWDLQTLIAETFELLDQLGLKGPPASESISVNKRISTYPDLFQIYHHLDLTPWLQMTGPPHPSLTTTLKLISDRVNLDNVWIQQDPQLAQDPDVWLDHLFAETIQPHLGQDYPVAVYGFPASQAAMSQINPQTGLAERVEIFYKGLELGNGYQELQDASEQRARFVQDNEKRQCLKQPLIPIDELLLAALEHGLPQSAGMAIGLDRILMLHLGLTKIQEVLSFTDSMIG